VFRHLPHRRCVTPSQRQIRHRSARPMYLPVTKQHRIGREIVLCRPLLPVRSASSSLAFTPVDAYAEDIPGPLKTFRYSENAINCFTALERIPA
jgi:hypothetical protein